MKFILSLLPLLSFSQYVLKADLTGICADSLKNFDDQMVNCVPGSFNDSDNSNNEYFNSFCRSCDKTIKRFFSKVETACGSTIIATSKTNTEYTAADVEELSALSVRIACIKNSTDEYCSIKQKNTAQPTTASVPKSLICNECVGLQTKLRTEVSYKGAQQDLDAFTSFLDQTCGTGFSDMKFASIANKFGILSLFAVALFFIFCI